MPRLPPEKEIEFIELASSWRNDGKLKIETCLFLNFGYDRELPYNQLNLKPDQYYNISFSIPALESSNQCSIVLIADKEGVEKMATFCIKHFP